MVALLDRESQEITRRTPPPTPGQPCQLRYPSGMKYTPGLLAGELSGKAGSTVASHNRFGSYFRVRTIPVNPASESQVNARNNMAAISADWRTLTAEQRASWAAAALEVTLYDSLGRSYNPTGAQYHASCNRNVFVYDPAAAMVDTPPVVAAPVALLSLTITATSV